MAAVERGGESEQEQLRVLRSYDVLDTEHEADSDDLVLLAARV